MKKLKFLIIGPPTENSADLLSAVEMVGHKAVVFDIKEIKIKSLKKEFVATCGKYDVMDFDVVLFRGYNQHFDDARSLAVALLRKGKTIIEEALAGEYVRGKIRQAQLLTANGVPNPKTRQIFSGKITDDDVASFGYPLIAKPVFGRKGRGIAKIESREELEEFLKKNNLEEYLIQEYFPITSDFRIFVVGNEVVGGFRRDIFKGEYKSNIRDTPAEKIEVNTEMAEIAKKAVKAVGYEVAGVDLFQHEGKNYIIEVNVAPQWEKFKKVTGINPAESIIKYAINKYEKK